MASPDGLGGGFREKGGGMHSSLDCPHSPQLREVLSSLQTSISSSVNRRGGWLSSCLVCVNSICSGKNWSTDPS